MNRTKSVIEEIVAAAWALFARNKKCTVCGRLTQADEKICSQRCLAEAEKKGSLE